MRFVACGGGKFEFSAESSSDDDLTEWTDEE